MGGTEQSGNKTHNTGSYSVNKGAMEFKEKGQSWYKWVEQVDLHMQRRGSPLTLTIYKNEFEMIQI
jgi:hypothetical protein